MAEEVKPIKTERIDNPDGKEVSYSIEKKRELNQENSAQNNTNSNSGIPPFCQKCGNHLFKLNIDSDEYAYCPECGHKSLKQKDIHVIACID